MKFLRLVLLFSLICAGLALSAASRYPLRRLTVVNKAGMPVEISMTGKNLEQFYYLRVPEGSVDAPIVETFSIAPDLYASSIYYVELWDPVYGAQCGTKGQSLDLNYNVRVVVLPCTWTPPNGGEAPSILKYGGRTMRRPGPR